jgi:hypothetical protein
VGRLGRGGGMVVQHTCASAWRCPRAQRVRGEREVRALWGR